MKNFNKYYYLQTIERNNKQYNIYLDKSNKYRVFEQQGNNEKLAGIFKSRYQAILFFNNSPIITQQ